MHTPMHTHATKQRHMREAHAHVCARRLMRLIFGSVLAEHCRVSTVEDLLHNDSTFLRYINWQFHEIKQGSAQSRVAAAACMHRLPLKSQPSINSAAAELRGNETVNVGASPVGEENGGWRSTRISEDSWLVEAPGFQIAAGVEEIKQVIRRYSINNWLKDGERASERVKWRKRQMKNMPQDVKEGINV